MWVPLVIGAVLGIGFEAYSQYKSGNFDFFKLTVAGLTGAYGGFGKSLTGAIARGALAYAAHNSYQQLGEDCKKFDVMQLGRNTLYGAGGGFFGASFGAAGNNLYRNHDIIGKPINKLPPPNYGPEGAAIGAVVGGTVANQ